MLSGVSWGPVGQGCTSIHLQSAWHSLTTRFSRPPTPMQFQTYQSYQKWNDLPPFLSRITPTYTTWGPFYSWHKAADMHFRTISYFSMFQYDLTQIFSKFSSSWNTTLFCFREQCGSGGRGRFFLFPPRPFSFCWDVGVAATVYSAVGFTLSRSNLLTIKRGKQLSPHNIKIVSQLTGRRQRFCLW